MMKIFILLTLAAACAAKVGMLTVDPLDEGAVRFNVSAADAQAPLFGVDKASGARVHMICKFVIGTFGSANTVACGRLTCTAGLSTCALPAADATFTDVSRTTTGAGDLKNVWTFTRSRAKVTADDVDLVNGTPLIFNSNIISDATPDPSAAAYDTALGVASNQAKFTITLAPFTGTPGFTYSLNEVGSAIFVTMTTQVDKYAGLGFTTGTNTFPSWAIICQNTVADCIPIECTSEIACVPATTVLTTQSRTAGTRVAISERPKAGPTGLTIAGGVQSSMVWAQRTLTGATTITKAEGERASWSKFQTNPVIAAQTLPPFGWGLTMPTFDTAALSFSTNANKFAALGFRKPASLFPEYVVVCEPVSQANCVAYRCTDAATCAVSAITGTSTARSGNSIMYSRSIAATEHTITPGTQQLMWFEGAATAPFVYAPALVQSVAWTNFVSNLQFRGTTPAFGFTIEDAANNQKRLNITTSAGKYAGVGVSSTAFSATSFPSTVAICEPVSLAECGIYTCTAAATCVASTATVTQARVAASRMATITIPDTAFPTVSSVKIASQNVDPASQAAGSTSKTANAYWYEAAVPAAGLVLSPSLAASQTWTPWLASVGPVTTAPDFPISFTLPSASTLGVSMTPGTAQTAMLGWRPSLASTLSQDVVICAPSSVSTCLDVACASQTSCTTRATTILTNNTASGTSASFQRVFTAGDVKLSSANPMWLAYSRAATPASTTTLSATSAQGATWQYYSAAVPGTATPTSNSYAVLPTLIAGIIALTYVL